MASPFETGSQTQQEMRAEMKAKKEFESLYRKLLIEIHPDRFHKLNNAGKWEAEAIELSKDINEIKSYGISKGKQLNNWREKLSALKEVEININEFLKRTEEGKNESESGAEPNPEPGPESGSNPETEKGPKQGPASETKDEGKKTFEESEKERAQKAQEEINKNKSDKKAAEEEYEKEMEKEKSQGTENKEDRDEKMEELSQELEQARREYLEQDYKLDKESKMLRSFFGLKRINLGNAEADFNKGEKSRYEQALKAYMAGMAERKTGGKEMAEYLYKTEALERMAMKDQIRIENNPLIMERLKKGAKKIIDSYRALPWQKKIAYGAALGTVAGFGAGVGLGIAIGGATGTVIGCGYRAFCGVASATGFKVMLEGIAEKKKAKKDEERIKNILESSKSEGGEIDYEKLLNSLNEKIDKVDQSIQRTKQRQRWRTFAAVGGAGLTFFGGRWVAHQISDYSHSGGGGGHHPEVKAPLGHHPGGITQEVYEQEINPHGVPAEPEIQSGPASEIPPYEPGPYSDQILEVKGTGSGVESTIRDHLRANPDLVSKYNELYGEGKTFNEGEIAEKMYQHFEPDEAAKAAGFTHGGPDLVHEGAKITINPETMTIEEVDNGEHDLGYLHHGDAVAQDNIPPETQNAGLTPEEINKIQEYDDLAKQEMKVGDTIPEAKLEGNITPENPADSVRPEPEVEIKNIHQGNLAGTEPDVPINQGNMAGHESMIGKIDELTGSAENTTQAIGHTIKELSLNVHDNWEAMKDMSFSEALNELKPDLREKLSQMYEGYREVFGQEAEPKDSILAGLEDVKHWVGRMAEMAIKKGK